MVRLQSNVVPGYGSGHAVAPVTEQVSYLREFFPHFSPPPSVAAHYPEDRFEGCFALLKWPLVAPTYAGACCKLFQILGLNFTFCDYREERKDNQYLRLDQHAATHLQKVYTRQSTGIVIVPAQLGALQYGQSADGLKDGMAEHEFAFGPFEAACILLTHRQRLIEYDHLWMTCAGAVARKCPEGEFDHAGAFHVVPGELGIAFDLIPRNCSGMKYGCITGLSET